MRSVRAVISAVTSGLPSRSPPIQLPQSQERPDARRPRPGPAAVARPGPARAAGRRVERRVERPVQPRDDGEQRLVEERHRGPDLVERRRARRRAGRTVRHSSVISSRSRRRISRSSDGRQARVVEPLEQPAQRRSATSIVRRRASVGCAVRTGATAQPRRRARRARRRSARAGAGRRPRRRPSRRGSPSRAARSRRRRRRGPGRAPRPG